MSDEKNCDNTFPQENVKVEKWMQDAFDAIADVYRRILNVEPSAPQESERQFIQNIIARHYAPRAAKVRALREAAHSLSGEVDNICAGNDCPHDWRKLSAAQQSLLSALAALEADDA